MRWRIFRRNRPTRLGRRRLDLLQLLLHLIRQARRLDDLTTCNSIQSSLIERLLEDRDQLEIQATHLRQQLTDLDTRLALLEGAADTVFCAGDGAASGAVAAGCGSCAQCGCARGRGGAGAQGVEGSAGQDKE